MTTAAVRATWMRPKVEAPETTIAELERHAPLDVPPEVRAVLTRANQATTMIDSQLREEVQRERVDAIWSAAKAEAFEQAEAAITKDVAVHERRIAELRAEARGESRPNEPAAETEARRKTRASHLTAMAPVTVAALAVLDDGEAVADMVDDLLLTEHESLRLIGPIALARLSALIDADEQNPALAHRATELRARQRTLQDGYAQWRQAHPSRAEQVRRLSEAIATSERTKRQALLKYLAAYGLE